ncbi:MAG: addiction module protein [Inhella sp.]|jgi:hypothetical protein|uniref:addiction module protein n=1 Tax=Inhella sp. TaxID=1921806 RepID=UPI0022BBC052|nr:addiction module protein [Inhella sp.]MCZ8235852.1 hypothetical protein [Inhella sp.]
MGLPLETLEAELLQLPPAERARLLDKVVASLDKDQERDAAWDRLAAEREAQAQPQEWLEAGTVLARLRGSL